MFYLVIGLILGGSRGTSWFPIYLFAGIVAINLFSETLRNTTTSITDNAPLVGKIYLPRELFPVSACGVALVHFLPQAVLLFILTMLCGLQLTVINILFFLAGTLIIIVFALGLGLFFGAINALYRDAVNFVDLILMFATWIAPVLYPWHLMHDIASPWVYRIFMSDPLAGAVELFHNAFWLPLAPESPRPENLTTYVLIGAGISLVTLFAGQIVFRKMEASFAQRL